MTINNLMELKAHLFAGLGSSTYKKYMANVGRNLAGERMLQALADNPSEQYTAIANIFPWKETPEGVQFWETTSENWIEYTGNLYAFTDIEGVTLVLCQGTKPISSFNSLTLLEDYMLSQTKFDNGTTSYDIYIGVPNEEMVYLCRGLVYAGRIIW